MKQTNVKTMSEIVQDPLSKTGVYSVMVHTRSLVRGADGEPLEWERTFSSAGWSDNKPVHHVEASHTLEALKHRVEDTGLPPQWLLDTEIEVRSYNRKTRIETSTLWGVVFVPTWAMSPDGKTQLTNHGNNCGFQIVTGGTYGGTRYPKHLALDIKGN